MSKMSQLHAEISEQAYDMGYVSLEEALADGWEVDYENAKLVKKMSYSDTIEWLRKEEERAHKAWEKERDVVLKDLKDLHLALAEGGYTEWATIVNNAMEFIEKGEV